MTGSWAAVLLLLVVAFLAFRPVEPGPGADIADLLDSYNADEYMAYGKSLPLKKAMSL